MRKTLLAFVLLLMLFSPAAMAQEALPAGVSKGPSMGGVTEYRFANGFKALLMPDSSQPLITTNINYLVGSRHENYGESGMAHLLEHLLFKGSPKHKDPKAEFVQRGVRYNGTTYFDRTNYFMTFDATKANLDWALGLEADRMVNSFISKTDLDSEMTVVRNEFESGENDAGRVLAQRMAQSAFTWHNYGRPTIGARSDIENVPIDRLQAFYRTWYQPDNAVLVLAGDFKPEEALASIARTFGALPKPTRTLPRTYTQEPVQDGEREVSLRRSGEQQLVAVQYHTPAGSHPEYAAVDILTMIVGETPGGRLHDALVPTKLATAAWGYDRQLAERGLIVFGAAVPKDGALAPARAALLNVLHGLDKKPITADEVNKAKQKLLTQMDVTLTKTHSFATQLTEWIAIGDWRLFFKYRDYVHNVTAADVNRAAAAYLRPSNRTIGTFVPADAAERATIPPLPDLQAALQNYQGPQGIAAGESFELTPQNIDARTERYVAANGMKVALLPKKSRGGMVNARLDMYFGSEESKRNMSTACSAMGAMLMRGTTTKSRTQIRDAMTALKANLAVGLGGGTFEVVKEGFTGSFELLADILQNPGFPPDEFEQLKRASLSGLESQKSDPGALAAAAISLYQSPYPKGHWLAAKSVDEQIAEWNALTLDDVKRCYTQFAGANSATFSLVGDFDAMPAKAILARLFGNWKSTVPHQRVLNVLPKKTALNTEIKVPDKANANYRASLSFPMNDSDADYPALAVANFLIGGSSNSRLPKRVREKEGLSYSTGSGISVSSFEPDGRFGIGAIHAPENKAKVEAAIREELELVRSKGFSDAEVKEAVDSILTQRKQSRASDGALASKLASDLYLGRTYAWDAELEKKLVAVTARQVNAVVVKVLDFSKMNVAKAGDFK